MFVNKEYFRTNSEMTSTGSDYLSFASSDDVHLLNDSISATIDVLQSTDIWYWLWTLVCSSETVKDQFSAWKLIYVFERMLKFSLQIPVGVVSERQWCLKITPCTLVVVLDDGNLVVFPCGVGYCRNPILDLLCLRLEFHIQMTYIAYRPWVRILASQGWVTLEPHRTLERQSILSQGGELWCHTD